MIDLSEVFDAQARPWPQSPAGLAFAASGGLDSTLLLREGAAWARARGLAAMVLHVNYGLRGDESDGDEAFVRAEAAALGLPCEVLRAGPAPASGVQAWARDVRREWFAGFVARAWVVALAHHADDWAETVLMRMARGASVAGITGMRPWQDGLWRPFLGVTRAEIREIALGKKMPHREDASNAKLDYARNRIRHRVMPELEALFPGAARRMAEVAREAEALRDAALAAHTARADAAGLSPVAVAMLRQAPEAVAWHALSAWWRSSPLPQGDGHLNRAGLGRLWAYLSKDPPRAAPFPVGEDWEIVLEGEVPRARPARKAPSGPRFGQHRRNLAAAATEMLLPAGGQAAWRGEWPDAPRLALRNRDASAAVTVSLSRLADKDELVFAGGGRKFLARELVEGGLFNEIIKLKVDNVLWALLCQGELLYWDDSGQRQPRPDGKIVITLLKDP